MRLFFITIITLILTSTVNAKCNFNCSNSDPKTYWNKTKYAKSCHGPEFEHLNDKISLKTKINVSSIVLHPHRARKAFFKQNWKSLIVK